MAYNERFDKKMNDGSHNKLTYELKTKSGKIKVFSALAALCGAVAGYGVVMVPINLVRHSMSLGIAIECAACIGISSYLGYKSYQEYKIAKKDEDAEKEKVLEAFRKRQEERGRSR